MEIAVPFLVLLVSMLLGLPIAFSLGAAGVLGIWMVSGDLASVLGLLKATPYRVVSDYTLTTIPMFILMAYFTSASGIARDLYEAASDWFSTLRGGLAIASVFASGIFGAMSGASLAAAAVMSKIAIPNMRRLGYSDALAAGAVGVGSTLDILIPPSVAMVIYGIATETSIGKLLVAGVVPALVAGVLLTLLIWVWVTLNPALAPPPNPVPWRVRWSSLSRVWPSLFIIGSVIVFLYAGVATPSELGALGALLSALVGALMGRLKWRDAFQAIVTTVRTTAMIFTIVIGAKFFAYYLTLSGLPQQLVASVLGLNMNRWLVISAICVGYFIFSMFMDEIPLLLLTLQLTFPLVKSLGFDPVWFGVVSMLLVSLGLVFPPVGMAAFVVSGTSGVDLVEVFRGTGVLMVALIVTLVLVMVFPQLALYLPATMR